MDTFEAKMTTLAKGNKVGEVIVEGIVVKVVDCQSVAFDWAVSVTAILARPMC